MAVVPYSGFYGPNSGDYSLISGQMPTRDRIKRVVNRDGFRQFKALANALIGAAAGGTATASHTRVSHTGSGNTVGNGTAGTDLGKPTVLTVTDINRVTTAADVAALKALLVNVTERPVPYPVDRSGNGGPALS